jgi:hypothetical protein
MTPGTLPGFAIAVPGALLPSGVTPAPVELEEKPGVVKPVALPEVPGAIPVPTPVPVLTAPVPNPVAVADRLLVVDPGEGDAPALELDPAPKPASVPVLAPPTAVASPPVPCDWFQSPMRRTLVSAAN